MTAELARESNRACRTAAARSIGSSHEEESSRRLFYVESESPAADAPCLETTTTSQNAETSFNQEDEAVRELALRAMTELRKRINSSGMMQQPTGVTSETRSNEEFTVMASGLLPCTAREVTHSFSPDNADRWNASMLEMFGNDFAYGVKVRSVGMTCAPDEESDDAMHLSIKIVHFSGLVPVLSKKTTTLFLDYVESSKDSTTSDLRTWRVVQTLQRDGSGVLQASDVVAGYYLEEDREVQHTLLYFLAAHSVAKVRGHAVQRLQKLASLVTKAGDIALRRRLGAQRLVDPQPSGLERSSITRSFASLSASVSASASASMKFPGRSMEGKGAHGFGACATCAGPLSSLLRRKRLCRVCGQLVCGPCASTQEVECRIGLVIRVPVCAACLERLQSEAFSHDDDQCAAFDRIPLSTPSSPSS